MHPMTVIPASHVVEGQKLEADAEIDLYELSPSAGGTLYFKPANTVTWQGHEYTGIPSSLSDIKRSSESNSSQPRLTLGEENIDLSIFKPFLFDGLVDGGLFIHKVVLLSDILANVNVYYQTTYRIKRVESYSRSRITMILSSSSDATGFTLPNQQYYPPDFPSVSL